MASRVDVGLSITRPVLRYQQSRWQCHLVGEGMGKAGMQEGKKGAIR